MRTLVTCLWFDGQAEAAAAFYVSVFKQAKLLNTTYFPEGLPPSAGLVLTMLQVKKLDLAILQRACGA